jgi:hypothetical protein
MADAESLHEHRTPIRSTGGESTGEGLLAAKTLIAPLSALAFWLAIALPALYLPLFVTGLESTHELLTFLGLFALHLLALFGGRTHRRT